MTGYIRIRAKAVLFAVLAAGVIATGAEAAPAGCAQNVLDAQQAMAQSRVAASKAVDDEIYAQDDSVLALTCFNQSASIAAQASGNIFSGDFRPQLASVVDDALTSMYGNFKTYTIGGGVTGQVNYSATKIDLDDSKQLTYNCDQPKKLWDAVNNQGVNTNVPYPSITDLTNPDPNAAPAGIGAQGKRVFEDTAPIRAAADLAINGDGTNANKGLKVPPQTSYKGLKKVCAILATSLPPNLVTCQ